MLADYFLLDGRDSRDFKVHLENPTGVRNRPFGINSQYSSEKVTGRDGEILFDQWYVPKDIKLECICLYDTDSELIEINKMKSWLEKIGTKKLSLSYELSKYRNVIITNVSDLKDYENQGSKFNFNIKVLVPFAFSRFTTSDLGNGLEYDTFYYDSGILYAEEYSDMYKYEDISLGREISVYNGGTYKARPNFIFNGDATTLIVEQYSDSDFTNKINEFGYSTFSGKLEINSLLSNTYLDNNPVESIEGDYPSIIADDCDKKIRSNYLEDATLNTITLDDRASSVNNFYNNNVIYIKNGIKVYVRTIIDYNGSTKIATLDSELDEILDYNWEYSIVNVNGGMSYFKIIGTGFFNLDLFIDFRFTYI